MARTTWRWLVGVVALLALVACGRAPDLGNPHTYAQHGIRFSYPGNWSISDDKDEDGVRHIVVEGPGDAMLVLQIFAQPPGLSLEGYARAISQGIGESLPVGRPGASHFRSPTPKPLGNGHSLDMVLEQADLVMLGQHVAFERAYYQLPTDTGPVLLMFHQSMSEDHDKVQPGFDLILRSVGWQSP